MILRFINVLIWGIPFLGFLLIGSLVVGYLYITDDVPPEAVVKLRNFWYGEDV